jgi:hypothetical protein
MKKTFSRREVLGMGAVAGAALLGTGLKAVSPAQETKPAVAAAADAVFPWPYKTLDVKATRARAYKNYFKGGCMFGVFEAVAAQVAEQLGKPYTGFPFKLSTYGGGGVALWGTLCGTCNGAAMAVGMFHEGKLRNQLISEIFTWYEDTKLPLFIPDKPVKTAKDFKLKPSQAKSTLCHVSITRWTNASGFESFSPERAERCARLVADMAGFTAELLNKTALKKFTPKSQVGAVTAGCLDCHAKGKQAPNEPEVVSKMSCTACHKPHD